MTTNSNNIILSKLQQRTLYTFRQETKKIMDRTQKVMDGAES